MNNIYFVLNTDFGNYVRVTRKSFQFFLSSLDCKIWKTSLFDGNVIAYFDNENYVEYFDKPFCFIVNVR